MRKAHRKYAKSLADLTDADKAFIKERYETSSDTLEEIGGHIGCSIFTVREYAKEMMLVRDKALISERASRTSTINRAKKFDL